MIKLIKKDLFIHKNMILATLFFYLSIEVVMMFLIIYQKSNPWGFMDFILELELENIFNYSFLLTYIITGISCFLIFSKENLSLVLSFPSERKDIYHAKMLISILFISFNLLFSIINIPMIMTMFRLARFPNNLFNIFDPDVLYSIITAYMWLILSINMAINISILYQSTIQFQLKKKYHLFISLTIFYLIFNLVLLFIYNQLNFTVNNYPTKYIGLTAIMFIINLFLYLFSRKLYMRVEV